jgi:hypothetical protein
LKKHMQARRNRRSHPAVTFGRQQRMSLEPQALFRLAHF